MGQAGKRVCQRQGAGQSDAGPRAGICDLCRGHCRQRRSVPAAPDPGSIGGISRHGSADRSRAGNGGRALLAASTYEQSEFNRAGQALRQPGSSFKPLVYAAALDNGYTPSTVVLDAPIEIDTGTGIWAPENYTRKYYGPSTLRFGIEQSRNVMTVRLAQDIGMPLIAEYAKRFGVYDSLPP